jgi:NAD(P)-dependent dehydrogenase (short-subunit alcohol dehydrogenase family)
MGHLEGKVAIVTGAGRGIGRGEALLLAAEGVDEIKAAGGSAVVNTDDVASWDGAERLISQAVETFGDMNVLVNNAGVIRDRMSFNMDEADFDLVMKVHLKGHFAPARFAAAYWRQRSKAGQAVYGRIVNTTSEAGLWGTPGQVNYATAKGGICSMTVSLARELHRLGVTVNAIAPRARTRMMETVGLHAPTDSDRFDDWHPDNIAPIVGWLASESAADVSGHIFVVTGGRVHLLDGYTEVGLVARDSRWTVDYLIEAQGTLFGDHSRGLPGFGITY